MSDEEIRQRAEGFIQSIRAKRLTAKQVTANVRKWVEAGFLTIDQWHTLVGLVAAGI